MKKTSELATRYAKALYLIAEGTDQVDQTLEELMQIREVLLNEPEIIGFVTSPLVGNSKKESVINDGLNGNKLSPHTKNFLKLLAKKDRFEVLPAILNAYQDIVDDQRGVVRGVVKSTAQLSLEEKSTIESKITQITGKKVLLNFDIEKDLVGGLKAEVGTYTFDDSLTSHLNRLNEDLNRRTI